MAKHAGLRAADESPRLAVDSSRFPLLAESWVQVAEHGSQGTGRLGGVRVGSFDNAELVSRNTPQSTALFCRHAKLLQPPAVGAAECHLWIGCQKRILLTGPIVVAC